MSFYETHELHRKEELRTRWYQGSYEEMKKAIFAVADYLGYGVYDCNEPAKRCSAAEGFRRIERPGFEAKTDRFHGEDWEYYYLEAVSDEK